MSNVAKYIDKDVCEILLLKLSDNPDKYNRLLTNNKNNSLYLVSIKDEKMIMKISDLIEEEQENNKMLKSPLPLLYTSVIYDLKLFSFYEQYDNKLGNLFKIVLDDDIVTSIIKQIDTVNNTFFAIFGTFTTCKIDNFLFKVIDNGIQISLFDYEKSSVKIDNPIEQFFLYNASKYISNIDMVKYGASMNEKFKHKILKQLKYTEIDETFEGNNESFIKIFNKWIQDNNLVDNYITYINKEPFNFPYYYPKF